VKRINKVSKLKLVEFLNRIPLFSGLSGSERNDIANLPNLVVLIDKDEVFIKKGEQDSSFFILLNGEVTVTMDQKPVATVGPGHFIGEVGFMCAEPRSATVTASSDVIALRINKELFDHLPIKLREGIKNKIIAGLVDRVVVQNSKIVDLEEKVAEYLDTESEQQTSAHPLDIKQY